MEDWQGCLAPECQAALVNARDSVRQRGGAVITVEDFLLALLDESPRIIQFLRSNGVDIDELVRTIQCEQPIVTEVGGEGLLSSQLIDWFAQVREVCDAPWLDWSVLLQVLTSNVERLRDKAYVAVLEQVTRWPGATDDGLPPGIENHGDSPLVITDSDWLALADEVAIHVATSSNALVWVKGERGTGKSCWLRIMLAALERDYLELDLRRERDVLANDLPVLPLVDQCASRTWPLLVLDNMPPVDLLHLMERPGSLASELVANWAGPILLVGSESSAVTQCDLASRLGRHLDTFDMPGTSEGQREAVLTAHQATIERHWNVEIPLAVIRFAATRQSQSVSTPGGMLQWVERAAARLNLLARRGPMESVAMAGQTDTLRRQSLVALARGQCHEEISASLRELQMHKATLEVFWHERRAAGTLRQLCVADLQRELECWVAARSGPVHYVLHCDHQDGDSAGAGSGNIHS